MNKLSPENYKDIEINSNIENLQTLLMFLVDLSKYVELKPSDILDFLQITKENNPKKVLHKKIAQQYAFYTDEEKEDSRDIPELKDLDFSLIETYAKEFLEKNEKNKLALDKLLQLILSANRKEGLYKQFVEALSPAINIDIDTLYNTEPYILVEIFKDFFIKTNEETVQGFFIMKTLKILLNNINISKFIKLVK